MAEYRDRYGELQALGAEVVAISVDPPERAEPMRQSLSLPFPVLCDTRREVVRGWGLLNEREHGGIAHPAVFALDPGLRVRYRSLDSMVTRVRADGLISFLRGDPGATPRRRSILLYPLDILRAFATIFRRGMRTPYK